jgi:transcriptional pleiotropic repressor
MSQTLLEKTRQLNMTLQGSGTSPVSFKEISKTLSELLEANVFVISRRGKVLAFNLFEDINYRIIEEDEDGNMKFMKEYNEQLLEITNTRENILEGIDGVFGPNNNHKANRITTVIPINNRDGRLGTLVVSISNREFSEEDLVLCEYSATVVGMEILRSKAEVVEQETRQKMMVKVAIGTLSYSELEALEHILRELDGNEGLLVASKIADRVGITRSVIVNALRKFESAGIIESRSLGMKGTFIKVLNSYLFQELNINK